MAVCWKETTPSASGSPPASPGPPCRTFGYRDTRRGAMGSFQLLKDEVPWFMYDQTFRSVLRRSAEYPLWKIILIKEALKIINTTGVFEIDRSEIVYHRFLLNTVLFIH